MTHWHIYQSFVALNFWPFDSYFLTFISGTDFHSLSHGVIHFLQSASLSNHFLIDWNSSTAYHKLQGFHSYHSRQNGYHTMWKSMKNCSRNYCWKLCAFLFGATCAAGKMWWYGHIFPVWFCLSYITVTVTTLSIRVPCSLEHFILCNKVKKGAVLRLALIFDIFWWLIGGLKVFIRAKCTLLDTCSLLPKL